MKKVWLLLLIVMIVIFVPLDLLLESGHGDTAFPWSNFAGFFSLFGFIGCLAIIGFAKLIGHYWLQRKDNYYDKSGDNE